MQITQQLPIAVHRTLELCEAFCCQQCLNQLHLKWNKTVCHIYNLYLPRSLVGKKENPKGKCSKRAHLLPA